MEKDTAKVYKLYFPISFCKFKDDVSRFWVPDRPVSPHQYASNRKG